MKAGNYTLQLGQQDKYTLVGTTTFFNASDEEINAKTGGCGPDGIGDWMIPDTILGEYVFYACRIHDWMYGEGITQEDKMIADIVFLVNMTIIVADESDALDFIRLKFVMTYFQAVHFGGDKAFNAGRTIRNSDNIDSLD